MHHLRSAMNRTRTSVQPLSLDENRRINSRARPQHVRERQREKERECVCRNERETIRGPHVCERARQRSARAVNSHDLRGAIRLWLRVFSLVLRSAPTPDRTACTRMHVRAKTDVTRRIAVVFDKIFKSALNWRKSRDFWGGEIGDKSRGELAVKLRFSKYYLVPSNGLRYLKLFILFVFYTIYFIHQEK